MTRYSLRLIAIVTFFLMTVQPLLAGDIVADWDTVKMPPPPPLKAVTVDSGKTALLLLDFDAKVCNAEKRPRCFATLPGVAALLETARAHGVLIAYSTVMTGSVADVPPSLAAKPGDPVVRAGVDKLLGTDLTEVLKAHDIRTVIVTGTAAHGAALYTASGAALRGFEVIVPVDGISADDPFAELAATWILAHAPQSVSSHVTLTRLGMIGF
jgi:nicotinamidase-related amidase